MNKLILLKGVINNCHPCKDLLSLVISYSSIECILPWDGDSMLGCHLLRIKNYRGNVENYVISREQYNYIVKEFNI